MAGRPETITEDTVSEICSRISDGESLRSICLSAHMPCRKSVFMWLLKGDTYQKAGESNIYSEFLHQYVRAREVQADSLMDEITDIADETELDWKTKTNKDGSEYRVVDNEAIQRSKLRVETRFRMAERLFPKRWGTKQTVALEGGDPSKPINTDTKVTIEFVSAKKATDE